LSRWYARGLWGTERTENPWLARMVIMSCQDRIKKFWISHEIQMIYIWISLCLEEVVYMYYGVPLLSIHPFVGIPLKPLRGDIINESR
jgi:hypothetical protein